MVRCVDRRRPWCLPPSSPCLINKSNDTVSGTSIDAKNKALTRGGESESDRAYRTVWTPRPPS